MDILGIIYYYPIFRQRCETDLNCLFRHALENSEKISFSFYSFYDEIIAIFYMSYTFIKSLQDKTNYYSRTKSVPENTKNTSTSDEICFA